jgi:hypothetical protein
MIIDIRFYTPEEYNQFKKDNFYYKENPPEIEIELQELQRRLLVDKDLSVLKEFKSKLAIYAESHLKARLKGTSDFIEPLEIESMAETAAENFLKRYFRNENPIIGASFSGVLFFKVTEVLSDYFKNKNANVTPFSLEDVFSDQSNSDAITRETLLSYQEYLKKESEERGKDQEVYHEMFLEKIEKECELLKQIKEIRNADLIFLKFLIYVSILQVWKRDKKLTTVVNIAEKLLADDRGNSFELNSMLESAFLDCRMGDEE